MHKLKVLLLVSFFMTATLRAEESYYCDINSAATVELENKVSDLLAPVLPLITIHDETYIKNTKATYCTRDPEAVDTIIFHHSETRPTVTPHAINASHINRSSDGDAWYMIGYNYVLNAAYPGEKLPLTKVTQGRPFDIVGAHSGSLSEKAFTKNLTNETKKFLLNDNTSDETKVLCGSEKDGKFTPKSKKKFFTKDAKGRDQVLANYTSVGVVIIGNYSPFNAYDNQDGYPPSNPRYPTAATIEAAGRLACELQRQHPRIKNILWHSYFKATDCPGTIKQRIAQIKQAAGRFGCVFN